MRQTCNENDNIEKQFIQTLNQSYKIKPYIFVYVYDLLNSKKKNWPKKCVNKKQNGHLFTISKFDSPVSRLIFNEF